ncbi:hypothetical protein M0804_015629 [Polistes exclamans]|nr:hypothetical protein M0804_015629 [Polistes exclamans]
MIAQAYEILCTPSTSNLLMISGPSSQLVIKSTKIGMDLDTSLACSNYRQFDTLNCQSLRVHSGDLIDTKISNFNIE